MAITLSTAAKDAANDALVDLIDAGAAESEGRMRIKDSGGTTLVDIAFDDPAFGDSSSGTATLLSVPLTGTAVAAGTAAEFDVLDKDNTTVYSGTVGLSGSGADAIIDSTTIQISDTVQLNSHTVTAP